MATPGTKAPAVSKPRTRTKSRSSSKSKAASSTAKNKKKVIVDIVEKLAEINALMHGTTDKILFSWIIGQVDDLQQQYTKYLQGMDAQEIQQAINDENSPLHIAQIYLTALNDFVYTEQRKQTSDMLDKFKTELTPVREAIQYKKPSAIKLTSDDQVVSANVARMAAINLAYGIGKLTLPNSGFWVVLKAPDMADLIGFVSLVDQTRKELGKMLGGIYYAIHNVYLVEEFMKLFKSLVVNSNLQHWKSEDTLINNISLQDLETCFWAVCISMFEEPIDVPIVCIHEACDYKTSIKLDLQTIRVDDYEHCDYPKLLSYLDNKTITEEDALAYRSQPAFFKTYEYTWDTGDTVKYHVRPPTIGEHLEYLLKLIEQLKIKYNLEMDMDNTNTINILLVNIYRAFRPWIFKVEGQPKTGKRWITEDKEAIEILLSSERHNETTFLEDISNFIQQTKVAFYGYAQLQCPKCNKTIPENVKLSDLQGIDIMSLFFVLSGSKLNLIA